MAHGDDQISVNPQTPLSALIARAREMGGGAAPVEQWNPPDCGPIPMRIAVDGTWHYRGTPVARDRLVRLFASILRREPDGSYALVSPVEKMTIEVDDAPFVAVELVVEGMGRDQVLTARTNVGDVVAVGADHPLRIAEESRTGGFVPYLHVRGGLEARFSRPAALDLAGLATSDGAEPGEMGVWSGSLFFPFGRAGDAG